MWNSTVPQLSWAGPIKSAIRTAARARYSGGYKRPSASSMKFSSSNANNASTTRMLTTGDNVTSLYRRKRKRRKTRKDYVRIRKAKRFKKKVVRVIKNRQPMNLYFENTLGINTVGTSTLVNPEQIQVVQSDAKKMMVGYGTAIDSNNDVNRIHEMIKNFDWGISGVFKNDPKNNDINFYVKCRLTMTLFRESGVQWDSVLPVDYDVYECTAAKDIANTAYDDPASAMSFCLTQSPNYATSVNVNQKGVSPFDVPSFGEWWTINKVTRVRLSDNQKAVFTLKSNFIYDYERFTTKGAIKGKTRAFMVIADPTESQQGSNASQLFFSYSIQKAFKFKPLLGTSYLPSGQSLTELGTT